MRALCPTVHQTLVSICRQVATQSVKHPRRPYNVGVTDQYEGVTDTFVQLIWPRTSGLMRAWTCMPPFGFGFLKFAT